MVIAIEIITPLSGFDYMVQCNDRGTFNLAWDGLLLSPDDRNRSISELMAGSAMLGLPMSPCMGSQACHYCYPSFHREALQAVADAKPGTGALSSIRNVAAAQTPTDAVTGAFHWCAVSALRGANYIIVD